MKILGRLRDLPVRLKTMLMIMAVLALLAGGMEGFLLRYMRISYERSAADFAGNLARSIALAVRNDFAVGNIFHVDRVFLGLAEEMQGFGLVRCVLLDENNVVAADLRPEFFGQRLKDERLLRLTRGATEPILVRDADGRALVAAAAPVFSHVNRIGTLVLLLSMEDRAREYRLVALLSVLLTVGFIALLGVLMVLLLRGTLLGPLEDISAQAAAVAGGDFDRHIALARRDEFGQLADALESMRAGVIADREKFRTLVEGSQDIIFTMDEHFRFTSGHDVVRKRIAPPRPDFSTLTLPDLLYEHAHDDGWTKAIMRGKLQTFLEGTATVRYRIRLRARSANEPLDFELVLEHLEKGQDRPREILGRLSTAGVDRLSHYFASETLRYEIENYIAAGDELAVRISRNLGRFISEEEVMSIEMGLRELIINAIEHGNLAITFDEKTAAQQDGTYMDFIDRRRRMPEYSQRRVVVESELNDHLFTCTITDEGDGFDHVAMRKKKFSEVNEQMLMHGRGLLLIADTFDSIVYNDKGNQVTLTRRLRAESA